MFEFFILLRFLRVTSIGMSVEPIMKIASIATPRTVSLVNTLGKIEPLQCSRCSEVATV